MSEQVIAGWSHRTPAVNKIISLADRLRMTLDLPYFEADEPLPNRPTILIHKEQEEFVKAVLRTKAMRDEVRQRRAYSFGHLKAVPPLVETEEPTLRYYFIDEPEITCSLQSFSQRNSNGQVTAGDRLSVFRSKQHPHLPESRITQVNMGRVVKGRDRFIPVDAQVYGLEYLGSIGAKLQVAFDRVETPPIAAAVTDLATPEVTMSAPDASDQYPPLRLVPPLAHD